MVYTILRGKLVSRYPDLPRQGPQPDSATLMFRPETPALIEALPRRWARRPTWGRSSVRLDVLDALETHFGATHQ
jgi:hypothetical protein